MIETCLYKLLIDRDVQSATEYVAWPAVTSGSLTSCLGFRYVKQTISDLLQNKVDMSQLVITKALSKTGAWFRVRIDIRVLIHPCHLKIMLANKRMLSWQKG